MAWGARTELSKHHASRLQRSVLRHARSKLRAFKTERFRARGGLIIDLSRGDSHEILRMCEDETGIGRRLPPCVYIFDAGRRLVGSFEMPAAGERALSGGERDGDELTSILRGLLTPAGRGSSATRAVILRGSFSGYAVLIEPERRRDAIRDASVRCRLSARESEILDFLVRGRKRCEIASKLGIGEPTVQSHVRKIGSKLGCKHRSEIVARALGVSRQTRCDP